MKLTVSGCAGSMSGPRGPASCYLVQGTAPGDDGAPVTTSVLVGHVVDAAEKTL